MAWIGARAVQGAVARARKTIGRYISRDVLAARLCEFQGSSVCRSWIGLALAVKRVFPPEAALAANAPGRGPNSA
ncbi:hypothetical protein TRIP_B110085 [uncultured Desulfatiglans sp.]|nr:hypothetical protein TRIP_B110085 [uncultured Desulfatiglans sp.]